MSTNASLIYIDSLIKLYSLDTKIKEVSLIAVDTETNGLTRFRQCIGISFAFKKEEIYTAAYIPLLRWDGTHLVDFWDTSKSSKVRNTIKDWLRGKKHWIGHNIVFDSITIENAFGVDIIDNVFSDTALLHHTCISEDPPHGLKPLAVEYISSNAASAQEDLAASVIANGGVWKKDEKDFYRADPKILGIYGALDPYYTLKLHEMWYPEIEKQGMNDIWFNEVLPMVKVMKELNSTGMNIDVLYFQDLKTSVEANINKLERSIMIEAGDSLKDYEYTKVLEDITITPRSEIGKILLSKGEDTVTGRDTILNWYKAKKQVNQVFSLNSRDDLAFLLYDVLKLPVLKTTKSGQRAVDKKTLDELLEQIEGDSVIISGIKERSKEIKLLNTYIIPILENQVDGKVYPQFNQIGTTSGRFTSSEPINFQTLPRDDLRIKKGFIAGDGQVIVNADFSSLEPRIFADRSNEPEIKRVYSEGLDLYSHVYKMVMQDNSVSAREGDENFLKKVNPLGRNQAKAYTLGFAYGMSEYKYASTMGVEVETAKEIKDKYFAAFKNLKKYHQECERDITTKFFVTSLAGRRRRAKLIPLIMKRYKTSPRDHRRIIALYDKIQADPEYLKIAEHLKNKGKPIRSAKDFKYAINNEINNSYNFPIQGLAASVANMSCIQFYQEVRGLGIPAKLVLQVHDEITVLTTEEFSNQVVSILKNSMEHNRITKKLSVEMVANPLLAKNLSEAK